MYFSVCLLLPYFFSKSLSSPIADYTHQNHDARNVRWGKANGDRPVARTQQGYVRGIHVNDAVSAFKGIPFAQTPVGDLRFKPPMPLPTSEGDCENVLDASEYGPVCYQFHYRTIMLNNTIETTGESEDCLTLNVFVPRGWKEGECLPTLFWMYPGGFVEGGGSMPIFDPTNLVVSQPGMIVVTLNYRMNIFGFPNSPAISMDAQNLGLRDMRAALEWLRDNIVAFGGDPSKITMGGDSSGADAAAGMVYSHQRDPIARALLLESGYPALAIGANPHEEFFRVAGILGCRDKANSTAELECMREVPAKQLKHAVSNNTLNPFGSPFGGNPMIDNVTLFTAEEYAKRGDAGDFAKLPLFIGNNANEVDSVLNWSPDCGINKTLSGDYTTAIFQCPMSSEASYRSEHNVPVWRYRYNGVFPSVTFFSWLGAFHEAEVPMLLGSYKKLSPHKHLTDNEAAASALFQNAISAFVRDPHNGPLIELGWPKYDPNRDTLIDLFSENKPEPHFISPSWYDAPCANPPTVSWEFIAAPPPNCSKNSWE